MKTLKVAAYTGGRNVPSSRFRVRQLIPYLEDQGIYTHEFVSPVCKYPPANKLLRPLWAAAILPMRMPQIVAGHFFDVTLLQREFVSTLYTLEGFTRKPRVLDVDDAIFLRRNGNFAKKLAKESDLIICGNGFLADYFSDWNANVKVLPTAVDCDRFSPRGIGSIINQPVIGWIGSSSNSRYLKSVERALATILKSNPNVIFRIVSDRRPDLPLLPSKQFEFVPWSSTTEAELINSFTIGIMPLDDGDWERGKCSFKMLQYMSCAIPVIVSPVGMNKDVLEMGGVGLSAESNDDWIEGLKVLLNAPEQAAQMGLAGRRLVLDHFSTGIVARQLSEFLWGLK